MSHHALPHTLNRTEHIVVAVKGPVNVSIPITFGLGWIADEVRQHFLSKMKYFL